MNSPNTTNKSSTVTNNLFQSSYDNQPMILPNILYDPIHLQQQHWKLQYNLKNINESIIKSQEKSEGIWSEIAFFKAPWDTTTAINLDKTDDIVVASGINNSIGCWYYNATEQYTKELNIFSIHDHHQHVSNYGIIKHIDFVNELHQPLLLTCTDKGHISIYKNYHHKHQCELITSWTAFDEREREFHWGLYPKNETTITNNHRKYSAINITIIIIIIIIIYQ